VPRGHDVPGFGGVGVAEREWKWTVHYSLRSLRQQDSLSVQCRPCERPNGSFIPYYQVFSWAFHAAMMLHHVPAVVPPFLHAPTSTLHFPHLHPHLQLPPPSSPTLSPHLIRQPIVNGTRAGRRACIWIIPSPVTKLGTRGRCAAGGGTGWY